MELAKIDPDHTLSQAHPETMDLLSRAWCDFALQALKPDNLNERSLVLRENSMKVFGNEAKTPSERMMDGGDEFVPTWKANDLKSWIWMQQAMHPEVNYNSYFRKKWETPWNKIVPPLKYGSIKKWVTEMKRRRKEERRLRRAEVHAAVSVAGVAAALAAIAAENSRRSSIMGGREAAAASAAALVAAQCAKVAEAMGATREQLSGIIGSAVGNTGAGDIVTLAATAATAIRGVETLTGRTGCRNSPVLPLEDSDEVDFDFEKCRSILARGAQLNIETTDGRYRHRSVAMILTKEGKVVLITKKLNMLKVFTRRKESVVESFSTELYSASEDGETKNGYFIVIKTDKGVAKLDMANNYQRFKTWSMTIDHMLMLSNTFTRYDRKIYEH